MFIHVYYVCNILYEDVGSSIYWICLLNLLNNTRSRWKDSRGWDETEKDFCYIERLCYISTIQFFLLSHFYSLGKRVKLALGFPTFLKTKLFWVFGSKAPLWFLRLLWELVLWDNRWFNKIYERKVVKNHFQSSIIEIFFRFLELGISDKLYGITQ